MSQTNNHSKFSQFINKYVDLIIRWRWFVVIGTLIITFFIASGAQYLRFDTDYRAFFGDENPQLQSFEEIQNIYTKNDNILFVLASKDGGVFDQQVLDAVEKLTSEGWQIPFSIRVDAVTNFQHTRAEGDELIVEDLVENALSNFNGSGIDLGTLVEYLYDDRDQNYFPPNPFDNHIFVGARLAFNDVQSTDLLAGAVINKKNGIFDKSGSKDYRHKGTKQKDLGF